MRRSRKAFSPPLVSTARITANCLTALLQRDGAQAMSFTQEQIDHLDAPLSKAAVKDRKQGGATVSYIEGWHAIAEANRIFGV